MHQLTDVFCQIDNFCNGLDDYTQDYTLTEPMKGKHGPACGSLLENLTRIFGSLYL